MAGKAVFLCCISAWIWVLRRANFFQGHDRQPNAQAVDLGTSACKFLLVDETGKVCNQVSREYPLSMPHTGWSEQDPSSWWQACLDGIPALLEGYAITLHYAPLPHRPRQRIQGAGGSSQGNQHRQAEYAHQGRGRCIPLGLQQVAAGSSRFRRFRPGRCGGSDRREH